jgi:hypothetical protein
MPDEPHATAVKGTCKEARRSTNAVEYNSSESKGHEVEQQQAKME